MNSPGKSIKREELYEAVWSKAIKTQAYLVEDSGGEGGGVCHLMSDWGTTLPQQGQMAKGRSGDASEKL